MWSTTTQGALVAIIVAVATTVALLLRSRRNLHTRFAAFAISIATYYATTLVAEIAQTDLIYLQSARIVAGSGVIITATIFFDAILGEAGVGAVRRRRKTYYAGIAMAVAGMTPLAGYFYGKALAATVAVLLLGARVNAVLKRALDVESTAEAARLRYLAYGGIFALSGFILDQLSNLDLPVPPLGGVIVAVYLYFISQALMASRLLDLHELLGKALVFGTLALILALVYGLLVIWVGERRGLFLFNTLVASGIILILFDPLRTYLEETTTRVFFREQATFARSVRQLTRELATEVELPSAIELVLDGIYDAKRATHTAVFLLDAAGMGFSLQGHRGPRPVPSLDAESWPGLFSRVLKTQNPLLRESLKRREEHTGADLQKGDASEVPMTDDDNLLEEATLRALSALNADLVIPARSSGKVLGLVCLRDERLAEAYSSEEIAALMQLAGQLAVNVENSRVFGVLRERDRLATLGEMSAGLAHEIRNPLAAIKGAAQELDLSQVEGEDGELLEIIVEEVNRLNDVVSEFLDYARPFGGTFSPLAANDAVRRTLQLLGHDLPDEITMELDLEDDLPDVNGDAQQIQQVLINLLLNAVQAMKSEGTCTISTRSIASSRPDAARIGLRDESPFVEVRVRDTGPGIPDSVRENLFIPFFTTKARGTGLGLPLCQRVAQHHGGALEVRSVEGQGATFILRLPALARVREERALPEASQEDQVPPSADATAKTKLISVPREAKETKI